MEFGGLISSCNTYSDSCQGVVTIETDSNLLWTVNLGFGKDWSFSSRTSIILIFLTRLLRQKTFTSYVRPQSFSTTFNTCQIHDCSYWSSLVLLSQHDCTCEHVYSKNIVQHILKNTQNNEIQHGYMIRLGYHRSKRGKNLRNVQVCLRN